MKIHVVDSSFPRFGGTPIDARRVGFGFVSARWGVNRVRFGSDRSSVDRVRRRSVSICFGCRKNRGDGQPGRTRRVEVFRDACVQSVSSDVKFKRVECASG